MSSQSAAYLLLGTNLGDRKANLTNACNKIRNRVGTITKFSKLYETSAWGKTDQPNFLNQAILVETELLPHDLLKTILEIETEMGRTRAEKWEARTIDIDILLFNDAIINLPDLIIPHPHLHERNFALIPLMDIAAEVNHPILNITIEELYFECSDPLDVFLLED